MAHYQRSAIMSHQTLEQVIRQYIPLTSHTNAGGWYQVLCRVCNDHGKKGKRAGFRFDGGTVGYNCFNCNHSAIYEPSSPVMPDKMATVLNAFNVPKEAWLPIVFENGRAGSTETKAERILKYEPPAIEFPSYFSPLTDKGDEVDLCAIEYLRDERGIDWTEYPFYIGRASTNPLSKKWFGRLIIPIYKDGQLIFYTGRDLTGLRSKKYLNLDVMRESVLYGYENIFKHTDDPLYIVEGWFDAWHLQGVAVFTNRMTPQQIYWINQSRRPKVVVPDYYGRGFVLGKQALEQGWSISTPFQDFGQCKDPNEAIMKYGKLFTMKAIAQHTSSGLAAEARLQFYKHHDE